MNNLKLNTSQLLMLKDVLKSDMDSSGWSEVDYDDVDLMQYYLDRAKVLVKVQELLGL